MELRKGRMGGLDLCKLQEPGTGREDGHGCDLWSCSWWVGGRKGWGELSRVRPKVRMR